MEEPIEFLFADYTQKTEALVTGVRLQNEEFDIYEMQLLRLDKNDSCSYTNSKPNRAMPPPAPRITIRTA